MNDVSTPTAFQQAPESPESEHIPGVVGIGGSAGGLEAMLTLLESLDADSPAAFVVVLHLSPDHESHAAEVLQRVTSMPVHQVKARMRLEAGHVYVIAPGMDLITDDGHIQPAEAHRQLPPSVIDLFFRSIASVHRERAVAIVLSGVGRDGSLGLASVREYGGITVAQNPISCEHADMPRAAIAMGVVDLVLHPTDIGKRLADLVRTPRPKTDADEDSGDASADPVAGSTRDASSDGSDEQVLGEVISALRTRTRHDFRHYKRATVWRRIERRMQVNGLKDIRSYRDFVVQHPEELTPLLADMLISVTNFFRDPKAFKALQSEVVPALMNSVASGDELRVWVTACASGEEAYSIVILLREQADRMPNPPRLQVFASDINDAALSMARSGTYPANIVADVSEPRLAGYFDRDGDGYRVRPMVRERVVFAHHNLLSDPPFSKVDFICCRNLLIYLDRTAQAAALEVLSYALKPGGYLFLGSAESVEALSEAFEPIDKEHRIYRLLPEAAASMRTRLPAQFVDNLTLGFAETKGAPTEAFAMEEKPIARLHELSLVAASPPSVLINSQFQIERVSPGAGRFVAFGEGIPTRSLLNNVAPDIRVELRTALLRASESQQSVRVLFRREEGDALLELSIHPLDGEQGPVRWLVLFDEPAPGMFEATGSDDHGSEPYVSTIKRLDDENRSLKALLQDTLDRSAVSGEELRASNEELQAINEEMHSAKEELETSKEELQAINEELTTVNYELGLKVVEAGRNNDDLLNLIEASNIATVFVDPSMQVKRFTPQASKLFSLIPTDVGRPLMDVKSRLRYDEMVTDAMAVFRQLRPIERAVDSIDGGHFLARINPYRTSLDKIGGAVLTFVDISELRDAQESIRINEERLYTAIASSRDFSVITMDNDGIIRSWNEGATRIFGFEPHEILGKSMDMLFTQADRDDGAPAHERREATRTGRAADERWHLRKDGSLFYCSGVVTRLQGQSGFLKIARDASLSKDIEVLQEDSLHREKKINAEMAQVSALKDRFLAVMSHELKQPLNLINVNAELLVRLPEVRAVPAVQRIGDTILRAVAAQETIVNDLLDLSRIQTGKLRLRLEPTDLGDIVRRLSQALVEDAARKSIALVVEGPEHVVCDCDPVRIEQVVWNLLGNAVKFTPPNGRVDVQLAVVEGHARLDISDTGLGIARESLSSVFELFSQGSAAEHVGPQRAGLGIGLALVRELVLAHHGRVEAHSDGLGQGSRFTIWLPIATRSVIAPTAAATGALDRRILMVDDDADTLDIFAELLTLEGASVHTSSRPLDALAMLADGGYDVLLSDIGMPEMSGLAFMQRVQALQLPNRPICIAISGYGRDVDERAALAAGFDAHLSKPISLERLTATLRRLLPAG